jgi:hypothetical protein
MADVTTTAMIIVEAAASLIDAFIGLSWLVEARCPIEYYCYGICITRILYAGLALILKINSYFIT